MLVPTASNSSIAAELILPELDDGAAQFRDEYHLTAGDGAGTAPGGALAATGVQLNGQEMNFNMSGGIPSKTYVSTLANILHSGIYMRCAPLHCSELSDRWLRVIELD